MVTTATAIKMAKPTHSKPGGEWLGFRNLPLYCRAAYAV